MGKLNKTTINFSFDFDDTLDDPKLQRYVSFLIKAGHNVHIVTSRPPDHLAGGQNWNEDIYQAASYCGILKENIHFLNLTDKVKYFKQIDIKFNYHIDDLENVINRINNETHIKGILYQNYKQFKEVINF